MPSRHLTHWYFHRLLQRREASRTENLRLDAGASAAACRLNRGDIDLLHRHHRVEGALGFRAAGPKCVGQYAWGDLPRKAPPVFAPPARAFLSAIVHDRIPVAVGLFLAVRGDLERKG